jgi:hypothetical protein
VTKVQPIPMLLTCPSCGERHIDTGDFATKPHHTHACQHCGMVWRPALVPTVGVRFLPGFKDGEPAPTAPEDPCLYQLRRLDEWSAEWRKGALAEHAEWMLDKLDAWVAEQRKAVSR